jgi:hypothetical protein
MKIRIYSLACLLAAASLTGCAAVYRNTDACETLTRTRLADVPAAQWPAAATGRFSVSHTGAAIRGSRVVVEGALAPAQRVAQAAASTGAPADHASKTKATTKRKAASQPVAAQCTFDGPKLTSFRWLSPAILVNASGGTPAD